MQRSTEGKTEILLERENQESDVLVCVWGEWAMLLGIC